MKGLQIICTNCFYLSCRTSYNFLAYFDEQNVNDGNCIEFNLLFYNSKWLLKYRKSKFIFPTLFFITTNQETEIQETSHVEVMDLMKMAKRSVEKAFEIQ